MKNTKAKKNLVKLEDLMFGDVVKSYGVYFLVIDQNFLLNDGLTDLVNRQDAIAAIRLGSSRSNQVTSYMNLVVLNNYNRYELVERQYSY